MVKACFPYFGSKRKIANLVWQGFGNVINYVEPFAGSLAVLLANPNQCKIETVNDKDRFLINFWRAVSNDPEGVAKFAEYPITEADLHARHRWLLEAVTDEFKTKLDIDPHFYDLKIAGWWVWGIGASIGNNWLNTKGLKSTPILSSAGGGIHGLTHQVLDWFKDLQKRTKRVRICCGDWKRVVTPSVTYKNKGLVNKDITGVFLDPPYDLKGRDIVYNEDGNVFKEVFDWAIANGNNSRMRIIMCGYKGDFQVPDDWKIYSWSTNGGFANMGNSRGRKNSLKEQIWVSPYCERFEK